ncbi:Splicing factor 3B subunit 6-like protein [Mycena sanguinolenta]|uniref:Splicing factor 3B subunit 6-like protein n=1 Tax=Mycena sanguinolenta TaxID=230812 RepID=A0A8H6YB52_9AGAR|nr:Splicing factor 3B subunit 6-like protein [Mycena sanguinolenta]
MHYGRVTATIFIELNNGRRYKVVHVLIEQQVKRHGHSHLLCSSPFFFVFALARPSPSLEIRDVTNASLTDVATAFSKAGIVPGVIPVFEPTGILDVVFTVPTTQQAVNATPGANLTTQQTANEPQFVLTASDTAAASNAEFVVALFDPDAPTPQNTSLAQFRHFLGAGFQWNASTGVLSNTTVALTEFFPPGPPPGSDPHRYTVLVYVQSEDFASKASSVVNASTPRTNFNMSAFSEELGLGAPVAGTFFFTGPDATTVSASSSGSSPSATTKSSGAIALRSQLALPPGANRILFVKNLNYQITGEDLYDLFGRYGTIRQIRIGNEQKTKGTAFVVFDDVMDAKNALDHLNGFHLQERYIVVLYHMPAKQDAAAAKADLARREEELAQLKKKHNIGDA